MTEVMQALIKGKPSVKKRGFKHWDIKEGNIYLIGVEGDTTKIVEGGAYSFATVKNMTEANATIYDDGTDRMSSCSVYTGDKGLYFKKNGAIYLLDSFKE